MKKQLFACILSITVLLMSVESVCAQSIPYSANDTVVDSSGKINAMKYAKENYMAFVDVIYNNQKRYGVQIDNLNNLIIGEPYIIYDSSEKIQNASYYFPIYEGNEVKLIMNVIESESGWSASMGIEGIESLNSVDYKNNGGIVYRGEENVYIENKHGKAMLYENEEKSEKKRAEFEELNMKEKKKIIDEADDSVKISLIAQEGEQGVTGASLGISTGDGYAYLSTDGCVGQGNYDLCWAACIAGIYNYRYDYHQKTAKDVANAIQYGYIAADDETISRAFRAFNLNYYERGYIEYGRIRNNINSKRPVMVICKRNITGVYSKHAITVMGYNVSRGLYLVQAWDPLSETFKIITYGKDKPVNCGGYEYIIKYGFSYK